MDSDSVTTKVHPVSITNVGKFNVTTSVGSDPDFNQGRVPGAYTLPAAARELLRPQVFEFECAIAPLSCSEDFVCHADYVVPLQVGEGSVTRALPLCNPCRVKREGESSANPVVENGYSFPWLGHVGFHAPFLQVHIRTIA